MAGQRNEDDYRLGLSKDLGAEKDQFATDLTLDDRIGGIDKIVTNILSLYLKDGILDQCECIVCNIENAEAARYIGRKFKLDVIPSFYIPFQEVFVTTRAKADRLILSRKMATQEDKSKETKFKIKGN